MSVLRGDQQNQQVATQQVNELLTAPDAKVYATDLNGAPVSFVVSKERDQALFLGDDVPPPVRRQGLPAVDDRFPDHPERLVDRGGDVTQWMIDGPLEDAQQLAVTVEPAGGSPQPTTDPIAGVEL